MRLWVTSWRICRSILMFFWLLASLWPQSGYAALFGTVCTLVKHSLCCPEMQFFTEQWKLQVFFFLPSSFMKYVHEAVETGPIKAWRDITEEAGSQVCNLKTNQLDYFSKWYTSLQHWDFFHISLAANLQLEQIKSVEVTGSQICSIHVHTCTCMYVCMYVYVNIWTHISSLLLCKVSKKTQNT